MNKIFSGFLGRLEKVFSIDLRALAFFRIFMGGIIFVYLIPKLMNVYAFFSDWGLAPRKEYFNLVNHYYLSFHLISGETWVQIVLILIQMFIAVLLILGYRTRLVTVLSWLFLVSLQNRNPFILNYGDQLFRMLLFWAMFFPLGQIWSLDNIWHNTPETKSKSWFSVATTAILLQMVLFYVVNWFLKDSVEWKGVFALSHNLGDLFKFNTGFTATYYATNLSYLVTPFGEFLLRFPELIKWGTVGYIFFELLGPLALISPFKTNLFRYISISIFLTVVHGMLFLMLHTGLFQFFCAAGLILFLPSPFWDWFEKGLFGGKYKLKIFYDQECELCITGVCVLKGSTGSDQIIPIQLDQKSLGLHVDISTIIVEDETGKRYTEIDAFIKMFENAVFTTWIGWILRIPPIYWLAGKLYKIVSKRRRYISKFISFIKPDEPFNSKILMMLSQGFATICLVIVIFWNYGNIAKKDYFTNQNLYSAVYMLRLDQYWGMFADKPTQESVWLVVPGKLRDGTDVDVMNKTVGGVNYGRQGTPWRFWSQSWRNYFIDYPAHNNQHTKILARYLCNDWNRYNSNYSKQLDKLIIYTMEQKTLLEGRAVPVVRFYQEYSC